MLPKTEAKSKTAKAHIAVCLCRKSGYIVGDLRVFACVRVCLQFLKAAPAQHYEYRSLYVLYIDRAERTAVVYIGTKIVEDKDLIVAYCVGLGYIGGFAAVGRIKDFLGGSRAVDRQRADV